ncbi:MAG: helix-turn-helix domain-containing protein [Alkalispirochaeta sp.]
MSVLSVVAALGAVQGTLLLILIAARYRCRKNVPFALFLLAFSVRLGTVPAWRPEVVAGAPWVLFAAGPLPLLFGPLIWWYVRALAHEFERPPRRFFLHAVPWAFETVALAVFLLTKSPSEYREVVRAVFDAPLPWWMTVRHVTKIVHGGIYAIASARIVFGHEGRTVFGAISTRRWAQAVVIAPLLSLGAFGLAAAQPVVTAPALGGQLPLLYLPALIMMVTIYGFTLLLLLAPTVLAPETGCGPPGVIRNMPSAEVARIAALIEEYLDSGIYRDPNLTEASFARALGLPPKRVSAVINHEFDTNFCQLVHRKRLDDFLKSATAGSLQQHTILELALAAGFPSKSTFNRVFKEYYGRTPSAYVSANRPNE